MYVCMYECMYVCMVTSSASRRAAIMNWQMLSKNGSNTATCTEAMEQID